MECFRLLLEHLAWIEHQFWSGIRDSRKARSLWGMIRGVGGVRKSIHQSWLAKGLELGLLCWGFKGVQQEIRSEEASTLEIGSVAFPQGNAGALGNAEYPFIAIAPRSSLARSGSTWKGPIYGLNWTNGIPMLNWIVWVNWIAWNRNVFDN